MPRHEPVGGDINQPFNSGSGGRDGLQFIRCVVGRQTEIHEVWTFGDNGITPEVHLFVCLDVRTFIEEYFGTYYLAENGSSMPTFGRKFINESIQWLRVPRFLRNYGPPWTDNILCPSPCWGVGGTVENWAWGSRPGGRYCSVDVPWRRAVPDRPAYLPWSSDLHVPLCAASVTISFGSTVWCVRKVSRIFGTFYVTRWAIRQIAPWMIFGTNRFFNNFCGNFPW